MKVLVTGGRGLLGGAVVAELTRRGHRVTVLQRSPAGHPEPVLEVLGEITDTGTVARAVDGCHAVVHLAAKVSMVGEAADFEHVNVGGTATVLSAARDAGVQRFVQVSSPSVAHAGRPLVGASAEPADPRSARGNYARTKAQAELLALAADTEGFSVMAVRPHLVWGPGDTQLIGRIAERARRGRLVLVDDGAALIDTTYVDNAADAIAQALDHCADGDVHGRPFVVSNGEPRTVVEILTRVALAAGGSPPTRHVPYPLAWAAGAVVERAWERSGRAEEPALTAFIAEQLATAHWFDQRETRRALHWQPAIGLDEGFRRLAAAWRAGG
ncbi:MAG: NAD-dependent epimerase/dehydratase family protein [Actinobacteria bacterium]|nr:NAD-dependent epimerase/dehydratase family protein [Actinomycetota bacterium]